MQALCHRSRLLLCGCLLASLLLPAIAVAAPGQSGTCFSAPCVDPAFAAAAGPTVENRSWSSSTDLSNDTLAWYATFDTPGNVASIDKASLSYVRAVRTGSCH